MSDALCFHLLYHTIEPKKLGTQSIALDLAPVKISRRDTPNLTSWHMDDATPIVMLWLCTPFADAHNIVWWLRYCDTMVFAIIGGESLAVHTSKADEYTSDKLDRNQVCGLQSSLCNISYSWIARVAFCLHYPPSSWAHPKLMNVS